MSGIRPDPAERRVADQHLGDRLSALVDGELGHDSRERVLAHLATCAKCKAEADAQRRLKNVFAEVAPPPPSESFLARLQGLPGGGDSDDGGPPPGGGAFFGRLPGSDRHSGVAGVFGVTGESFGYVPARPHADVLPPSSGRGFRIHDVGRHETDRSASRGLRFAFAAAGAVSLAAVALGGVSTGVPGDTADARGGSGSGSNVTPLRSQGTGGATTPDSQRRRTLGPVLTQGQRTPGDGPVIPTSLSAPLLPGVPTPSAGQEAIHTLTTPIVAGAAAMSPLIRPLATAQTVEPAIWSADWDVVRPGLLTAPPQTASPTPSPSSSRTP
ncbi:anti-sigma factor family protein [Streptomyces sp. NPDC086783]|uniref:anti-sigma factor family protein n=1 Tax=Streptomyces sp. NPDC086783 TaxID=3365758 RepID=UPI00382814B5